MDLDALLTKFRIASRDLFNHHFHRSTHDGDPLDASERFDEVEESLFRAMVTWPAGLSEIAYHEAQPQIGVASNANRDVPCLLSRKPGLWEEHALPKAAQLIFVRFFDWEELELRDNLYVLAEVRHWPGRDEVADLSVLVEAQYARFFRVSSEA